MNKNLRLDNIQVYGFDYDYTLAHYSPNLQTLIYDLAKKHMVDEVRFCLSILCLLKCMNRVVYDEMSIRLFVFSFSILIFVRHSIMIPPFPSEDCTMIS